eukprot:s5396_g2.t3
MRCNQCLARRVNSASRPLAVLDVQMRCKQGLARRLLRSKLDFPPEDFIFDCLVTPLGAFLVDASNPCFRGICVKPRCLRKRAAPVRTPAGWLQRRHRRLSTAAGPQAKHRSISLQSTRFGLLLDGPEGPGEQLSEIKEEASFRASRFPASAKGTP